MLPLTLLSNADGLWWYLHQRRIISQTDIDLSSPLDRLPNWRWYSTDCRQIEPRHGSDGNNNYAGLNSDPVVMNNTIADFELVMIIEAITNDFHQRRL
jgi:hypothetical protein